MKPKRAIGVLLKLCLIALALFGIFELSHRVVQQAQNSNENDHDADDLPLPIVDVRVGVISKATLHRYVTAFGTVEPAPASADQPAAGARLSAPVAGVVSAVDCVEGQRVEKGQMLFHLDARSADAAVEQGRKVLAAATARAELLDAARQVTTLWQQSRVKQDLAVAQADLDHATAHRAILDVASPIAGTIVEVHVRPGESADPNAAAVEVVDLARLVIVAEVPSTQLREIHVGQHVRVDLPQEVPGTVTFVDTQIDPHTGTGFLDVSLSADAGVRPGQFLKVQITTEEHADCLTVTADSIAMDADGGSIINLVLRETFQATIPRRVKIGLREGNAVEITGEGLHEGDVVVTQGAYGLPPRTKIHVLEQ